MLTTIYHYNYCHRNSVFFGKLWLCWDRKCNTLKSKNYRKKKFPRCISSDSLPFVLLPHSLRVLSSKLWENSERAPSFLVPFLYRILSFHWFVLSFSPQMLPGRDLRSNAFVFFISLAKVAQITRLFCLLLFPHRRRASTSLHSSITTIVSSPEFFYMNIRRYICLFFSGHAYQSKLFRFDFQCWNVLSILSSQLFVSLSFPHRSCGLALLMAGYHERCFARYCFTFRLCLTIFLHLATNVNITILAGMIKNEFLYSLFSCYDLIMII